TWSFPAEKAVYDSLTVSLDGHPLPYKGEGSTVRGATVVAARAIAVLKVSYRSQGLDSWRYTFGSKVSQVRDFNLRMTTNFHDIDFPEDTLSPVEKHSTGNGWELTWRYQNLVSGYSLGMTMPSKLQPGPLAGRISYFAPVSLFFFFFVMWIITAIR